MTAAGKRINARLSADVARKVSYLERRTGASTTQVILSSIEHYYDSLAHESPAAILDRAGFVGCAEGPSDLSRSYKSDLTSSLMKKS